MTDTRLPRTASLGLTRSLRPKTGVHRSIPAGVLSPSFGEHTEPGALSSASRLARELVMSLFQDADLIFSLAVSVKGLTWARADELVERCSAREGLPLARSRQPWFFRGCKTPTIYIEDRFGAGSILAHDADWNAPKLRMEPAVLPRLRATLRCLCEQLPEGFMFFAGWRGHSREERAISCADLLDLVSNSALSPKTRYRISPVKIG